MIIFGIDPGENIGAVALNVVTQGTKWDAKVLASLVANNPEGLCNFIHGIILSDCDPLAEKPKIVVEDVVGAGGRSKGIKQTIEVLGFVRIHYGYQAKWDVIVQQPQKRLHQLENAKKLLGHLDHDTHALAHVLAYLGYEP